MKIKTFLLSIILFMSSVASADPVLLMRLGGMPGGPSTDSGDVSGMVIGFESSTCGDLCFSPHIVTVSNNYGKNIGAGLDLVFRPVIRKKDSLRLGLGFTGFDKPLNESERFNFHLSMHFVIHATEKTSWMIGYDHFSNGGGMLAREHVKDNNPLGMLNLGFKFK